MVEFLDQTDISWQTPGRKDQVYIGKIDHVRQYTQKRYLQWTVRDLLDIVNGQAEPNDRIETFPDKFDGKHLTFRLLYQFLKCRKEYKWLGDVKYESCLCEICENIRLHVSAINRNVTSPDKCLCLDNADKLQMFKKLGYSAKHFFQQIYHVSTFYIVLSFKYDQIR